MIITQKSARINAGISQREAAEKLGVSERSLRYYESGVIKTPLRVLINMAVLYNVDIDNLKR